MKEIEYKGYYITTGIYDGDDVTVQYCGDDVYFNSVDEAKAFIDEITQEA